MPPAEKARATILRPVDLKAELSTGLEDFLGSEAGYSEREKLPKLIPSALYPVPSQCVTWKSLVLY